MDDASAVQTQAADPAKSTWLTANAGSGKTRVLTDRVARLLLRGAAPQRILCLTYTKAAATEMQNRLLSRLGEWAMLPEPKLRAALAALGEPEDSDLPEARRLFARAIETPGGLKVQTIHSFCAGILRRFPVEAGVPIGFSEMDDRSAAALRVLILEEMAGADDPGVADLIALHPGERIDEMLRELKPEDFAAPPDPAAIWVGLGLPPGYDAARLLGEVFLGGEGEMARRITQAVAGTGKTNDTLSRRLGAVQFDAPGLDDLAILEDALLTGADAKVPFSAKIGALPTKEYREGVCAPDMPAFEALMTRVEEARPRHLVLTSAERALSLHRFAHAFLSAYTARKAAHGWLDFDDLIGRTARLLTDTSMALWVLWRLDGGIDHILVDEAQDTSPGQWQVIRALTAEFTSGMGAREGDRTLFVVGDPKQSIYSFQGADIAVFDAMKTRFAEDFQAIQDPMQEAELRHSFRSSPAILSLVDAVFQDEAAQGLGGPPVHRAFHDGLPGRVDLWPALPPGEKAENRPWWLPEDAPALDGPVPQLARAVAWQIKRMLGQPFYAIRDKKVRPIAPGDILILVERRSHLFHALIGACKGLGLPIAGADRLRLSAELAVRDIRATLQVLALPEDDLSLAAALRSPLFGLSEDDLYRLAAGRDGFLIERLRASHHHEAREILADLAGQADFLRPHDLIARLLIRHEGRKRLMARLGPEAEDGIAELMSQALAYETAEVPSLTGFLVWLSGDATEVRRQASSAGAGLIRVMTVHGAKGLEAPVVILPETAKRGAPPTPRTIRAPEGGTLWRGSSKDRADPIAALVEAEKIRRDEERRRLLYVGLTRAESWLILAAAGDVGAGLDSWHALVTAGADRAGLTEEPLEIEGIGTGRRLSFGTWPDAVEGEGENRRETVKAPLPDWADRPAPRPAPAPRPIAATALGGEKALAGGDLDRGEAMLRGTRLHLLLEHLTPEMPEPEAQSRARAALAGAEGGLPDAAELAALMAEARAILTAPELTPSPGETVLREVALTAPLDGLGRVHGTVDRLVIAPDRIRAVDYKSNAVVPTRPQDVPEGILRQMAAYRAALRALYPDRTVETAVLWTETRALMPLPDAALDAAWARLLAEGVAP